MTMPFYVAPEQMMKDRADYARKGIARGRALVACTFDEGILLCAENPSRMLRKISEIYDRIGFAGVGKYNEFDQLRIAGVRHADLKGFSFSREDVDARSLANQYAQMLGQVFTHEMKPMEVEILVAEVGHDASDDHLFHILYDGTLIDEDSTCVLGGEADAISARLASAWERGSVLQSARRCCCRRARKAPNGHSVQQISRSPYSPDRTVGAPSVGSRTPNWPSSWSADEPDGSRPFRLTLGPVRAEGLRRVPGRYR
ncbi:MAG: proteasome subunit alpha [Microthrixaceae bacterium]